MNVGTGWDATKEEKRSLTNFTQVALYGLPAWQFFNEENLKSVQKEEQLGGALHGQTVEKASGIAVRVARAGVTPYVVRRTA